MFNSKKYWEERYSNGGTSGAGSRNRLAQFKIDVLNRFIAEKGIKTLIDLGSGDGFIASGLIVETYTGFDVSKTAVAMCNQIFEDDISKVFTCKWEDDFRAELAISLDIIFHLIEDDLYFEYLKRLFGCAEKYVIIYSSNCVSAGKSEHYKDRKFIDDVEEKIKGWKLVKRIANPFPYVDDPTEESNSDFYIYERGKL